MNARERFLRVMTFQEVDRTLMWSDVFWAATLRRFYREGLPCAKGIPDDLPDGRTAVDVRDDVTEYFGMDSFWKALDVNSGLCPPYEVLILEDHGEWVRMQNAKGMIQDERVDRLSFPRFVREPVNSREEWEQLKAERLQVRVAERLPADWPSLVQELAQRDYPIWIWLGLWAFPRDFMTVESLLVSFYDSPELVRDIIHHLTELWMNIYDQVLDDVGVDFVWFCEDLCYKNGPLISPEMFREFFLPAYKILTDFFRGRGIQVIMRETDGDCRQLIPLLIDGGINGMMPFEVTSGQDIREIRDAFPRLGMWGGLDKKALIEGPEAIDRELDSKVPFMLKRGGYIPLCDHSVAPDISWNNYLYYRKRLNEMILTGHDWQAP